MMRYYSIFSGIESASVAWEPLGWEPLVFSEIDEFPSAVLRHRYPNVPNLGDITKINWKEAVRDFGKPDIVVGGSPCQSFSIAGGRTGLDGASGLMWEYVRCVREVKPDWVLWENVPGALSSSHGEDFRCLLEALDACGYGLAWRVLDAQFFGVAQRRERLFLVGRLGDPTGPCKVLFEPESLSWDTPSSREKRQELASGAGRGPETAGGALNPEDPQSKRVFSPCGVAPTLSSGTGEGMNIQPSVLCAGFKHNPAVMCIPENAINRPSGGTNGPMAYGDGEPSPTLRASKDVPAVMCMTDTQPHSMVDGEVCGALSATMQKDPPVVTKTLKMRGGCEGGGKGVLCPETPTLAIDCRNDAANEEVSGTLQAKANGGYSLNYVNPVMRCGVVRRLTPRECERLMGMPDDWTKVPYRGRPAEECPDTPRYKAIGNSMAVPVMRWIGERIELAERGE